MKRFCQRPEIVGIVLVCAIAGALAFIGPIASASAAAKINYVAMGDSYSSGEGLAAQASGYISNLGYNSGKDGCHRADNAYPEHIKTSLGANLGSFTFVACSGDYTGADTYTGPAASAVSSFDAGGSMLSGRDGETAQISAKYLNPSVNDITLTIGGNDAGFAKVAASCISIMLKTGPVETVTGIPPLITGGSCVSRLASSNAVIGNGTSSSELASALVSTYEAILNDAPNARLAVLTYPQLLTPAQIPESQFCPLTDGTLIPRTTTTAYLGFTSNVQGDVNAMEEGVNNDINSAVATVGAISSYQGRIRTVDTTTPTAPFAQPCNTKTMLNSDINGIHFAPGDGIIQLLRCLPPRHNNGHSCDNLLATESLHPTVLGQDRMAIAAEDVFKESWQSQSLGSPTIAGASEVQMGVTVSGNTSTDEAIQENSSQGDSTPYFWQSAEYWLVNVTSDSPLTLTYVINTDTGGPILQFMAPGTTDSSVGSANGINFEGSASGLNVGQPGVYGFSLPVGTYVLAIGSGDVNGSFGSYSFTITSGNSDMPTTASSSASAAYSNAETVASGVTIEGNVLTDTAAVASQSARSAPQGWSSGEYWLVNVSQNVPLQLGFTESAGSGGPSLGVFSLSSATSAGGEGIGVNPQLFVDTSGSEGGTFITAQGWYSFTLPAGTYVIVVGASPDSGNDGSFAITVRD